MVTVVILCIESYPHMREKLCLNGYHLSNYTKPDLDLQGNSTHADEMWCSARVVTILDIVDIFCVLWFTMEFALFLWISPVLSDFLLSAIGIIDILSIVPVYVEYILKFSRDFSGEHLAAWIVVLRVLRCLRVMRILKIARYSRGLMVIGIVFKRSFQELLLVFIYTFILTAFFGTLVFYAEFGIAETKFTNIPDACWWAIVTLTTLGYGDMVPVTWIGKIIAAVATMSGVVLLAFPISIVVERFTLLYAEVVPSKGTGSRDKKVKKIGKHVKVTSVQPNPRL